MNAVQHNAHSKCARPQTTSGQARAGLCTHIPHFCYLVVLLVRTPRRSLQNCNSSNCLAGVVPEPVYCSIDLERCAVAPVTRSGEVRRPWRRRKRPHCVAVAPCSAFLSALRARKQEPNSEVVPDRYLTEVKSLESPVEYLSRPISVCNNLARGSSAAQDLQDVPAEIFSENFQRLLITAI